MTINEIIKNAKENIRNLFANNEAEKAIKKAEETKVFLKVHDELAEMLDFVIWVKNAAWKNNKMVVRI